MPRERLTILPPQKPLVGDAAPPGSKSITNRALLLAGLAKGTSRLTGALKSDDTRYMAEACAPWASRSRSRMPRRSSSPRRVN